MGSGLAKLFLGRNRGRRQVVPDPGKRLYSDCQLEQKAKATDANGRALVGHQARSGSQAGSGFVSVKKAAVSFLLFSVVLLCWTSCQRSSPEPSGSSAVPSTNARVFQVKGIVKAVRPERKEIEIKHEAIPDYMPAMTMPFDVKNTNDL